jgi:hypothetical protein
MDVNYWLYKDEFERHTASLDKQEPVELEIMDQTEKVWKKAKVLLFQKPSEGSTAVGLLGPFGELGDEGNYHIKVLEILTDDED